MVHVEAPRVPQVRVGTSADLRKGPVTEKTTRQRLLLFAYLNSWVVENFGRDTEWLALHCVPALSVTLSEFVYVAFDSQWTLGKTREAINALSGRFPWCKGMLGGPWRCITTWQVKYPSTPRWPIPVALLEALATQAILEEKVILGVLLLVGFFALLRPGGLLGLRREDILLVSEQMRSEDESGKEPFLLIRIRDPKVRYKRQRIAEYARLVMPERLRVGMHLCELAIASVPRGEKLWKLPVDSFRRQLKDLAKGFLTKGVVKELLPSGLRPGGATWTFENNGQSVQNLCWLGRWADQRMLSTYVQSMFVEKIKVGLTEVERSGIQERRHRLQEVAMQSAQAMLKF